jgi:intracellular sulfur oxidation DsrE/DsrF family protein
MQALRILIILALGLAALAAQAQDKVVYHFDGDLAQATKGLRNIDNHLEVDPSAKIVVVAHAQGVDFLMKGAQDANQNPYNVAVKLLKEKGVVFEVCEITMRNRKLDKKQFIPEVQYVPSGVVEVAHLQARQGYVYIKP